jgi:methyl-accepting chemotaxis protein
MKEQVATTEQVARSVDRIRRQSGQINQAMDEQSRATRDAVSAASNVSSQVLLISAANQEQSVAGEILLKSIADIRAITERNVNGVREVRSVTESLKVRSGALIAIAEDLTNNSAPARSVKPAARKAKKAR